MTSCTVVERASPRAGPIDREATLDELIAGLWEGLGADRTVACPVCGAEMQPQYGVHARAVGGRCEACGSALS